MNLSMLAINLDFLQPIVNVLNVILIPVVSLLATAGTIYSIILAVNMAKSDTPERREQAKKRIIGVLVTMLTLILLIVGLKYLLQYLPTWVGDETTTTFIHLL